VSDAGLNKASAATPAWLPGWTCVCFAVILAHDGLPSLNFLSRLRQPRNNCSNLIEYLLHAPQLTATFQKFLSAFHL